MVETLDAFEATGLLSPDEAEKWRARFARAAKAVLASDRKVVTQKVRARAKEMLEGHLERLAAQGSEDRCGSTRSYAMQSALKDVGAITAAEANEFMDRESSRLARSRPATPREPLAPPPRLLRVIAGPTERLGGVRVTAAELFDSCVRLWWHRTISPEEVAERDRQRVLEEGRWPLLEWRRAADKSVLSDDVGTSYEAQVPGSQEDTPWLFMRPWRMNWADPESLPLFGHAMFRPGVPKEATRLEAVSGSDRFVIDLAG